MKDHDVVQQDTIALYIKHSLHPSQKRINIIQLIKSFRHFSTILQKLGFLPFAHVTMQHIFLEVLEAQFFTERTR